MTDDRKNIKVPAGTWEELESDKPDGVTWGHYLLTEHRHAQAFRNREDTDIPAREADSE